MIKQKMFDNLLITCPGSQHDLSINIVQNPKDDFGIEGSSPVRVHISE